MASQAPAQEERGTCDAGGGTRGGRAAGARRSAGGSAWVEGEREVTRYITRRPEAQGRRGAADRRPRGSTADSRPRPRRLGPRGRRRPGPWRLGSPPPPAGPGVAHLPRRPRPPCPGPTASSGPRAPPPPLNALAAAEENAGEGNRSGGCRAAPRLGPRSLSRGARLAPPPLPRRRSGARPGSPSRPCRGRLARPRSHSPGAAHARCSRPARGDPGPALLSRRRPRERGGRAAPRRHVTVRLAGRGWRGARRITTLPPARAGWLIVLQRRAAAPRPTPHGLPSRRGGRGCPD